MSNLQITEQLKKRHLLSPKIKDIFNKHAVATTLLHHHIGKQKVVNKAGCINSCVLGTCSWNKTLGKWALHDQEAISTWPETTTKLNRTDDVLETNVCCFLGGKQNRTKTKKQTKKNLLLSMLWREKRNPDL